MLANVGDVTGGGTPTLAIGQFERVLLWESPLVGGSADADTASVVIADHDGLAETGMTQDVLGPGDVNGDGYADLVVSSTDETSYDDGFEYTWVFHGPLVADRTTADADTEIGSDDGCFHDCGELAAVGDVDGDGLGDLAILSGGADEVYIHVDLTSGRVDRAADAWAALEVYSAGSMR